MSLLANLLRGSELDRTTFPELRDRVLDHDAEQIAVEPRSHPGCRRWPLPRPRPRPWAGLEWNLRRRRSRRSLSADFPGRRALGRLLFHSHGVSAPTGRGPTPSAGGLQAVELYLAAFEDSWLPAGVYHYDRLHHHLSQLRERAERDRWREMVPALDLIDGGALLWVLVGDLERVERKYGERGARFLLLEAGHLMQNLCLLSQSLGLATVPLGAFFEREISRELRLPRSDAVLYTGVCGAP